MFYDENFYRQLKKPLFQPPSWVFRWIWSVLFLLMAVSLIVIMTKPQSDIKNIAIITFFIQLVLNMSWSRIFFIEHKIRTALVIAILLFICVFVMVALFLKLSFFAGLLQLPYLVWLTIAIILNWVILQLNPDKK